MIRPTNDMQEESIARIISRLVTSYYRLFEGRVALDELYQVAAEAKTRARKTFDPNGPAKFTSYVYRAVSSQLVEACRRGCSPVYATRNETSVLLETYAVPDDVLSQHESDIDAAGGLDAVVDRARAYQRIRQVIAESAGAELLEVLLGEDTLRALAGRLNVPLAYVRARKVAALDAIRDDQSIRQYVEDYRN